MKFQVAIGLLVLAVCIAGCTGAPDTVRVGEEENGSTVTVGQGGRVIVTLPYDTIDRYEWRTDLSSGLVVTDEQTAPGTQEWTVEPLTTGTFTFRALWVKVGAPDAAAEKTFTVTIRAE
ncbi:protease inhibitor I42 family protein [Methanofollis ethanolicus]|uniref:protease inhibitor I42 family protein n=1 Tax=Methanofollis ethanolicus TaxID=488124 RepID=UPI000829DB43|nr:protease inhibitor I42 family protein [Methanofollis ethanolicus]